MSRKKQKPVPPQPTVEEVREQFAQRGMPVDEWKERPEGPLGVPPIVTQSKDSLEKVRDLLQQQVATDKRALAVACEELARLERGGAARGGR